MKPHSRQKKQTQTNPIQTQSKPVLSAACPERSRMGRMGQFIQRPKSLAKKCGHTLYNLLCRYSLDGKHCDGIIAEIY